LKLKNNFIFSKKKFLTLKVLFSKTIFNTT